MSKDKEKDEKKLSKQNEKYMKLAIKEAKKAYKIDEVPIGCVIVQNDRVIAKGHNKRNTKKCALAHAEITAIKKACKKTGDWMSDVCWSHCSVPHAEGGGGSHEQKGWMCRIHLKSSSDVRVQSSV